MKNNISINLARLLLFGIIFFEFLNYFNILKFHLEFTWLGLIITAGLIWMLIEGINYFLKTRCHRLLHPMTWFSAFFIISLDMLGDILHFYSIYGWYDQILHFIGSVATSIIILSVLTAVNSSEVHKMGDFLIYYLTFTSIATLGVFYELEEYFEDYFTLSNRLGDGPDTMNDIFSEILGVVVIILLVIIIKKIKQRTSPILRPLKILRDKLKLGS